MEILANLPDEKLINLAKKDKKDDAISEIFKRYESLLKAKCRVLSSNVLDYDDLLQEGMIGIYSAIIKYDEESGVPFNYFCKVCINHQLISLIRKTKRKKHQILTNSVSLDNTSTKDDSSDKRSEFINLFSSTSRNPEDIILDTEKNNIIKSHLSPLENQIFLLFLDGYSYKDIAHEIKSTKKSVDNALQRIKKKLSNVDL